MIKKKNQFKQQRKKDTALYEGVGRGFSLLQPVRELELDGMMVIELLEHLVEHLVDAAQPAADLQEKVLRMRKTVGSQREIVGGSITFFFMAWISVARWCGFFLDSPLPPGQLEMETSSSSLWGGCVITASGQRDARNFIPLCLSDEDIIITD